MSGLRAAMLKFAIEEEGVGGSMFKFCKTSFESHPKKSDVGSSCGLKGTKMVARQLPETGCWPRRI